jgi:hypothetical protein
MTAIPAAFASAGVWAVHPGQHLHDGGLPGPVLADQGVRLTAVQVEGDLPDGGHGAERFRHPADRQLGRAVGHGHLQLGAAELLKGFKKIART